MAKQIPQCNLNVDEQCLRCAQAAKCHLYRSYMQSPHALGQQQDYLSTSSKIQPTSLEQEQANYQQQPQDKSKQQQQAQQQCQQQQAQPSATHNNPEPVKSGGFSFKGLFKAASSILSKGKVLLGLVGVQSTPKKESQHSRKPRSHSSESVDSTQANHARSFTDFAQSEQGSQQATVQQTAPTSSQAQSNGYCYAQNISYHQAQKVSSAKTSWQDREDKHGAETSNVDISSMDASMDYVSSTHTTTGSEQTDMLVNANAETSANDIAPPNASASAVSMTPEMMRLFRLGLQMLPVESKEKTLADNAFKISRIKLALEGYFTQQEWDNLVEPMLHGALNLTRMLPASDTQHESFIGGLFAHLLSVAILSIESNMWNIDCAEGLGNTRFLEDAFFLHEKLIKEFKDSLKVDSYVGSTDYNQLKQVYNILQNEIFAGLDLRSWSALEYISQSLKPLNDFDRENGLKMPDAVRRRWAIFLPVFSSKGQASHQLNMTDTQVLQARYQRLMQLERVVSVPSFSVNDFEALQSCLPSECKASLECLGVQALYYLNLMSEINLGLKIDIGLLPQVKSEFETSLSLNKDTYLRSFNKIKLDVNYNSRTVEFLRNALRDLDLEYPYLHRVQKVFAIQCMTLFFALAHDLGKIILDIKIYSEHGIKFEPYKESLDLFIQRTKSKVLWVDYLEDRNVQHTLDFSESCYMLAQECPATYQFLTRFFNFHEIFTAVIGKPDKSKLSETDQEQDFDYLDKGLLRLIFIQDGISNTPTEQSSFFLATYQKFFLGFILNRYLQDFNADEQKSEPQRPLEDRQPPYSRIYCQIKCVIQGVAYKDLWLVPVKIKELSLNSLAILEEAKNKQVPSLNTDSSSQAVSTSHLIQRVAPAVDIHSKELRFYPLGAWATKTDGDQTRTQFRKHLHYFGQLPRTGALALSMHDYLTQGQGLNTTYADVYASSNSLLVLKDSRAFFSLFYLFREIELGNIEAKDLLLDSQQFVETLKNNAYGSMDMSNAKFDYYMVRINDDLIIAQGLEFKFSTQKLQFSLYQAEFKRIDSDNLVLKMLLKQSLVGIQAIADSFQECKEYALQDDAEVLQKKLVSDKVFSAEEVKPESELELGPEPESKQDNSGLSCEVIPNDANLDAAVLDTKALSEEEVVLENDVALDSIVQPTLLTSDVDLSHPLSFKTQPPKTSDIRKLELEKTAQAQEQTNADLSYKETTPRDDQNYKATSPEKMQLPEGILIKDVGLPRVSLRSDKNLSRPNAYRYVIAQLPTSPESNNAQPHFTDHIVGRFINTEQGEKILFKPDFVEQYPILKEGYVKRVGRGCYKFFYSPTSENPSLTIDYAEYYQKLKIQRSISECKLDVDTKFNFVGTKTVGLPSFFSRKYNQTYHIYYSEPTSKGYKQCYTNIGILLAHEPYKNRVLFTPEFVEAHPILKAGFVSYILNRYVFCYAPAQENPCLMLNYAETCKKQKEFFKQKAQKSPPFATTKKD